MYYKFLSASVLSIFLISSCATFNKQTDGPTEITVDKSKPLEHSFYLIGDAGNAKMDQTTDALGLLKSTLAAASENSTVVFLGDNIYPKGLPSKKSEGRSLAEHQINVQIESVKDFKGNSIFIPGNHDWYSDGAKGVKRQQDYVEKALGKNSFLPKNGCPIKTIDVSENVVLIIVDSHWYVTNWDRHPTINDNCDIRTRSIFIDELRSEIKKARGKTTLIAIHHPMFSNGEHGGQFSFKSHMLPIPVLGSVKNLVRETSGLTNTDLSNRYYNELKKYVVAVSQQNDKVIFLSGHEHSLQYNYRDNLSQIVSGAGSKATAVRNTKSGKFGYAEQGFAVLDVYKDGSSNVRFISAKNNQVEFETQIHKPDAVVELKRYPVLSQDTVHKSIYTAEETDKSGFHKFLWGQRFRKDYSTPVTANVAYIDTLLGGLTPFRLGGGKQSKTLHLKTKDGKRYVLRSLQKQASQFAQEQFFLDQYMEGQFDSTFTESFLKDAFTGSYPYGTFIIGTLSDAANVAHLNPKLVYVPKQDALGVFNETFGDELCMFEEHPSKGHDELALAGNFTGKFISTYDMMQKVHKDDEKSIDLDAFVRARIFDMLIGDWDRHQDQWRWMEYKENGRTTYKPIPRDRDQAFSRWSEGAVISTAMVLMPTARLFRKYQPDLKDVKGFNTNAFGLDKAFLTDAEKVVWDEQAKFIQSQMTDEVIDAAFNNVPAEVNQDIINEIKETLKGRRDNLLAISDRYYELINEYAIITASDKDDYIKIEALDNGDVSVKILRKKGDALEDEYHNRVYNFEETREIWIYGLDDEDTFEVIGKSKKIKLRLVGGQNNDNYKVAEGNNVFVYDYKSKKNDVSEASRAHLKLQDKYNINVYDYKKPKTSSTQVMPVIGWNPDYGLKIGAGTSFTYYGFKRNPFTSQHKLNAAYYLATGGLEIDYHGEFAQVFGQANLKLDAFYTTPNFAINYFGYGNETINEGKENPEGLDYNRVLTTALSFKPSLVWRAYGGSIVSVGATYENVKVDSTENRFIAEPGAISGYLFDANQFAGVQGKFEYSNADNKAYPTVGMITSLELGFKSNIEQTNRNFVYLIPEIGFAHKLEQSGKLVLATRLKGHINFNEDYEFYQAAAIGGVDGPRGFRNRRFTGKQSYYQNTDLRYSFKRIKTSVLPIRLGLYGSFDYGRVWIDSESSDKWHNSYGGGVFLNAAEAMSLNIGLFQCSDGMRFSFLMGFGF